MNYVNTDVVVTIAFVLLALFCLPMRRMHVLGLRIWNISVRLGLLGVVVFGILSVWQPELVNIVLAGEWLQAIGLNAEVPMSARLLIACVIAVIVAQPVLAVLAIAKQAALSRPQDSTPTRLTRPTTNGATKSRVSSRIQYGLQDAAKLMSHIARGGSHRS